MDWTVLQGIISDASITIVFGFLWWFERQDRRAAEQREREMLLRMLPLSFDITGKDAEHQ